MKTYIIHNDLENMTLEERNKFLKQRIMEMELELRRVKALDVKYQENSLGTFENLKGN